MLVVLTSVGCATAEPSFQRESLREEEEPRGAVLSESDLEATRAAGLGATLSEGTPPPPFWPERDEESYPRPTEPEGRLRSAFQGGELLLVDVVAVEAGDRGRMALAQDVETGERVRVVLPDGYECVGPGRVVPGQRYVLIAGHAEGAETYELYLGVGAEHSVMPVDERGEVDTHFGVRDAMHLVESSRGAS